VDGRHRALDTAALTAMTARQSLAFALGSRKRMGSYYPSAVPRCR
jgi:hypothetical protein